MHELMVSAEEIEKNSHVPTRPITKAGYTNLQMSTATIIFVQGLWSEARKPALAIGRGVVRYTPATSNRAIKYMKSLHKTIFKRFDCKPVRGLDLINDLIAFK